MSYRDSAVSIGLLDPASKVCYRLEDHHAALVAELLRFRAYSYYPPHGQVLYRAGSSDGVAKLSGGFPLIDEDQGEQGTMVFLVEGGDADQNGWE